MSSTRQCPTWHPSSTPASIERFLDELWPRSASHDASYDALERSLVSGASDDKAMTVIRKLFARSVPGLARAVEAACMADRTSVALATLRLNPPQTCQMCLAVSEALGRRGDFERLVRLVGRGGMLSAVATFDHAEIMAESMAEKALEVAADLGHEDFVRAWASASASAFPFCSSTLRIVAIHGTPGALRALFGTWLKGRLHRPSSWGLCCNIVRGNAERVLDKLQVVLDEAPRLGLRVSSLDAMEASLVNRDVRLFIRQSAEFSALIQ